jgi:ComF family protein
MPTFAATFARLGELAAAMARGALRPMCPACAEPLDLEGSPLCRRCRADIVRDLLPDFGRCQACDARSSPNDPLAEGSLCRRCAKRRAPFGKLRGAVRFNAQSKELVHQLKYMRRVARADFMAELMAAAYHRHWGAIGERPDAVVPVPLHAARRWRRGFNQSEELARRLAVATGLRVEPNALVRARATLKQALLQPDERAANTRGAFAAPDPALVSRRFILLIDDVATSGATIRSCADALVEAGAARVDCLVFARA